MGWKNICSQVALFGFLLVCFASFASAQDKNEGPAQANIFIGKVLPNNVTTEDEIFMLWGLRYSLPSGGQGTYYDFGGLFGNNTGVKWQGAFASVRMDIPVETLVGHAGVGIDFTRFETAADGTNNKFGAHFIGGVMMAMGRTTYARFDMKLNTDPGTSLYFALGLTFNLEPGEASAN